MAVNRIKQDEASTHSERNLEELREEVEEGAEEATGQDDTGVSTGKAGMESADEIASVQETTEQADDADSGKASYTPESATEIIEEVRAANADQRHSPRPSRQASQRVEPVQQASTHTRQAPAIRLLTPRE